jgi:hypothetical protein
MKKTGIILSILVALLLVVLIVTALLPRIVSSDLMKPYVMQMVNQQMVIAKNRVFRIFLGIDSKKVIEKSDDHC